MLRLPCSIFWSLVLSAVFTVLRWLVFVCLVMCWYWNCLCAGLQCVCVWNIILTQPETVMFKTRALGPKIEVRSRWWKYVWRPFWDGTVSQHCQSLVAGIIEFHWCLADEEGACMTSPAGRGSRSWVMRLVSHQCLELSWSPDKTKRVTARPRQNDDHQDWDQDLDNNSLHH